MKKKPIPLRKELRNAEETEFEKISIAVLHGNTDELDEEQQRKLNLTRDAYKIVCEFPNKSTAVKKFIALHPEYTERTALNYINHGIKIWNPSEKLDREFLTTIFLTALIKEIQSTNCDAASRARNLATMERYISNLPVEPIDPEIMQKHTYNIQLNINGSTLSIPANEFQKLKNKTIITDALQQEITEADAAEILNS